MRNLFLTAFILSCSSFMVSAQPSELLLQHYQQAEMFVNEQRFDEARREYQKVIELDPMIPASISRIGQHLPCAV